MTKIKIKKLKNSFKKSDKPEKDRVEALLEDMNHNFKAFGEALGFTRESMGNDIKDLRSEMNHRFEEVDYKFETVFGELDKINTTLNDIKREIKSIKKEIVELKVTLSKKADIDKLKDLEKRVVSMERYLVKNNH